MRRGIELRTHGPALAPQEPHVESRERAGTSAPYDRVLLVEDEPRLRDMLLRALGEMGFRPTGATTAEAALKQMELRPFPMLIVDLNLPGIGGMDLMAAVRERWPASQLIILTGFGDLNAARQAIHLDVVDFLTKPCALGDLEIALGRAQRRLLESGEPARPDPPRPRLEFAPRETSAAATLEEVERQTILAALEKHDGNRNAAAEELGISLRKLYYRLAQYQKRGAMPQ